MKESGIRPDTAPTADDLNFPVPEEPFGIRHSYWTAGLLVFTFVLMAVTLVILMSGGTSLTISSLYLIPAILFPYFYRRKGVLAVCLLSMFYLAVVVLFCYTSVDDIFAALIRVLLLTAIALMVDYLTAHLIREMRKYHAIFENTENGVLLVNLPDHTILEQNLRFANALALPPGETQGRNLDDFVVDNSTLAPLFSTLDVHCNVPSTETVMRRGDGSLWVAVIAARKISTDHAVLTFIDITGRRQLDDQLKQCHAETSLYLDILTHDINNINTASLNYGRLLEVSTGEARADISRKLIRALEKSDDIIRNISTLRKMQETSSVVPLSVSAILRIEIAGFPDAWIEYDGTDAVVLADEMLSSVFINLIGNSIKFGGTGLHVVIRVEARDRDVQVSIEDDGPGIPDSLKPLLFERFRRGDTTVSGKGLGLFICRSLIERYGGQIRVEDRVQGDPSQGVAIRFTLKKGQVQT
ncbi:MAG: PAS domain-containing sensor histidine kinase [Methanoregula sp.]|nr:PAS domain-containing sensor histidine kinase [Methanoregula sp.]